MLVKFKSLLVFSEKNKKFFYTNFADGINIIKGKNTSGKSTLIQSLIYSLGINDGNEKLKEIIDEDVIFRLDLERQHNGEVSKFSFIRDQSTFFLSENGKKTVRFDGINSNHSNEHIKLKNIISNLFNFRLLLESKDGLKEAPLETMLLPYYVSQSVGWVYLRESFSGLNFYKNFKFDYLDYYLGITTSVDRIKLIELLNKKTEITQEINFLEKTKKNNEELQIAQLIDEEFKVEATKYLNEFSVLREELIKAETSHIQLCNKKSLATNRSLVLKRVKRNISQQRPEIDTCPVCIQTLPSSLEAFYSYQQSINDTDKEIEKFRDNITNIQSAINSVNSKIERTNEVVEQKYSVIKKYISTNANITFDTWLNQKSNVKLMANIDSSLSEKISDLKNVADQIKDFNSDADVEILRKHKEETFLKYFKEYLVKLNVSIFDESRYKELYKIGAFPCQGVELHKTVMAYHFALNKTIGNTKGIHRFPFILDAIMKEDIDEDNRKKIFSFLNECTPADTQMIFSVSESIQDSGDNNSMTNNIRFVNKHVFTNKGHIIQIGDGISERSFLKNYDDTCELLINETVEMIDLA